MKVNWVLMEEQVFVTAGEGHPRLGQVGRTWAKANGWEEAWHPHLIAQAREKRIVKILIKFLGKE